MDLLTFVLCGSTFAVLLVSAIKWLIVKITKKETETLAALIILFIVALTLSSIQFGFNNLLTPEVRTAVGLVFAVAVALFDVFKKGIYDGLIKK
jgi:asparagine N-glycosylation enzyme membrane subunit Stt3